MKGAKLKRRFETFFFKKIAEIDADIIFAGYNVGGPSLDKVGGGGGGPHVGLGRVPASSFRRLHRKYLQLPIIVHC